MVMELLVSRIDVHFVSVDVLLMQWSVISTHHLTIRRHTGTRHIIWKQSFILNVIYECDWLPTTTDAGNAMQFRLPSSPRQTCLF